MKKSKPSKMNKNLEITKKNIESFFLFELNKMQKECLEPIIFTDENLIISAPTASGKTVLFELSIIKNFGLNFEKRNKICIYIAPMKALCKEKLIDWDLKFKKVWEEFLIQEITGDTEIDFINYRKNIKSNLEIDRVEQIIKEGVVVITPEKLNIILRKWKEYKFFIDKISLIMIDEIHTLEEESRGVYLESLLTRILLLKKMMEFKSTNLEKVRIIALSATLKNIEDFAEWLEVKKENIFKFDESYRPVQLEKLVLGFCPKKNPFLFDLSLNYRVCDVIKKYGERKPVLVFVSTQKSSFKTCKDIIELNELRFLIKDENHLQRLSKMTNLVINQDLKYCIINGLGFHNASLDSSDREIVEKLFINNEIQVLVTTSTLSVGVNLPAFLVIIKGTKCYKSNKQGYEEYQYHEIIQMMGRAGRPQYEKYGFCVILTERFNVDKYEEFVKSNYLGREIESKFLSVIEDNLINEISLRTVKSKNDALLFFQSSFAFVRLKKTFKKEKKEIEKFLLDKIEESFEKLLTANFISIVKNENLVDPTLIGTEAARQNISIESTLNLKEKNITNFESLFLLLSENLEFKNIHSRIKERKYLNDLNKLIKFPVKKKSICTFDRKVFVIIQCLLLNIKLKGWELKLDQENIIKISFRILYFLKTYFIQEQNFKPLFFVLKLLKFLKLRTSEFDKFYKIKQNPFLIKNMLKVCEDKDIVSFEKFFQNPESFYNIFINYKKEELQNIVNFEKNNFPIYEMSYSLKKNNYDFNLEDITETNNYKKREDHFLYKSNKKSKNKNLLFDDEKTTYKDIQRQIFINECNINKSKNKSLSFDRINNEKTIQLLDLKNKKEDIFKTISKIENQKVLKENINCKKNFELILKIEMKNEYDDKNYLKTFFLFTEIDNPFFKLNFGYFNLKKKEFKLKITNPDNFRFAFINEKLCGRDIEISSLKDLKQKNNTSHINVKENTILTRTEKKKIYIETNFNKLNEVNNKIENLKNNFSTINNSLTENQVSGEIINNKNQNLMNINPIDILRKKKLFFQKQLNK